tara:strand:+ start:124 stop:465 length:342 start_codon:yes stop_codon:yes gene_type:complete
MDIIVFILCCFGLTQILVYGKIFDRIRPNTGKLGQLFGCSMCTGFWVGFVLWGINGSTTLFMFDNSILTGFLLGCLSSGTSYILCQTFGDKGIKHEFMDSKVDAPTSKTLLQG